MLPRASQQLGVIDVGSNTARFVIFETFAIGAVRASYEDKEVPRLGAGTGPDGELSDEAIRRGTAAMRRFAKLVRVLEVPRTLAVATSATREAPNGGELVRAVERSTGMLLRILSGAEEARYGYLGVASAWELENDIVLDLGGGSLQLAEIRRGELRSTVSLPLGALRLSQRFFEHDPPKKREMDELREHVRAACSGSGARCAPSRGRRSSSAAGRSAGSTATRSGTTTSRRSGSCWGRWRPTNAGRCRESAPTGPTSSSPAWS